MRTIKTQIDNLYIKINEVVPNEWRLRAHYRNVPIDGDPQDFEIIDHISQNLWNQVLIARSLTKDTDKQHDLYVQYLKVREQGTEDLLHWELSFTCFADQTFVEHWTVYAKDVEAACAQTRREAGEQIEIHSCVQRVGFVDANENVLDTLRRVRVECSTF